MNAPLNINMHSAPHMRTLTHVQARTVVATKVMTMQKRLGRASIRAIRHFSKQTLFLVGQKRLFPVIKLAAENVASLIFTLCSLFCPELINWIWNQNWCVF